jgi:hypothetical protein
MFGDQKLSPFSELTLIEKGTAIFIRDRDIHDIVGF